MSDIDFQNGFLCGMATKGLVRSGEQYQPIIWNDEGTYSYFYIDFRRDMESFSVGMFDDSIVVHDSEQLLVNGVEKVALGTYKVYCDISNKLRGITVLNKKTSRLRFASGERLPVFSVHMFISGVISQIEAGYVFDNAEMPDWTRYVGSVSSPAESIDFWNSLYLDAAPEKCAIAYPFLMFSVSDTPVIVLT